MRALRWIALVLLLQPAVAWSGNLTEADFAGVTPETFDGFDSFFSSFEDFGTFTLTGGFDSHAFSIPVIPPVVLPAPGGDTIQINLTPAVQQVGFHMGGPFAALPVRFYGAGDVLLGDFTIGDFVASGTGNGGFGYQGFVGWTDDQGRAIERVELGSGDHYFDNVYVGSSSVSSDATSMGQIKALFK